MMQKKRLMVQTKYQEMFNHLVLEKEYQFQKHFYFLSRSNLVFGTQSKAKWSRILCSVEQELQLKFSV